MVKHQCIPFQCVVYCPCPFQTSIVPSRTMVPEPRTAVIFSSALTSSSECETQDAYRQTRLVPGHHNNKPSSPPLAEHCLARRRFFLNLEDQNGARTVWADPVTKWTMNTLGHFRLGTNSTPVLSESNDFPSPCLLA